MPTAAAASTLGKLDVNLIWAAEVKEAGITALALSPAQDSILIAVEKVDQATESFVQLHSAKDGTCRGRVRHQLAVCTVAYSVSGQQALSVDVSCNFHSWQLPAFEDVTQPALKSLAANCSCPAPIHAALISTCGSTVYTGFAKGDDYSVKVIRWKDGELSGSWPGHSAPIISLAFRASSQQLLTGSYDKTVRIWDTSSGATLQVLAGHSAGVRGMAVSHDGVLCYTAAADNTIKAWHLERGHSLGLMLGRHAEGCWPNRLLLSPDGKLLVSGSTGPLGDGDIVVFRARGDKDDPESASGACLGKFCHILPGYRGDITGLAFLDDSRTLVVAASDGTIKMWRLAFSNPPAETCRLLEKKGPVIRNGLKTGFL